MLKKITLLAALLITPTVASAFTVGSNSITGDVFGGGTVTYFDTGAETVSLTDLTAQNSISQILLEDAGYANNNILGIYGFTKDSSGVITLGNTLEVFLGVQSTAYFPITNLQWSLNTATNVWSVTNSNTHVTSDIGTTFGFYIDSNGNSSKRYYSQSALNAGNEDYFKVYNVSDHRTGNQSDVVLGIEDLSRSAGGDGDYNDMVVGVNDVTPTPEPGTMMLLGAGFLGLAIYGKRRKNA